MNPRGIVSVEDLEALEAARTLKRAADENWRNTVLAVAERSSVREAAKAAEVSPDTISRWKRGD